MHSFRLILDSERPLTDRNIAALFDAGCDDATFGYRDRVLMADFDRGAPTFAHAVGSAIATIEATVPAQVVRVEPDELVSASVIAERTGRTRESVRLLIEGKRGPGDFPSPLSWVDAKTRLWEWSAVTTWFRERANIHLHEPASAEFLAALNAALELRRHAQRLACEEERAEVGRIVREDAELLGV